MKVGYRLMRFPATMFLIGAPLMFLLVERLPLAKGQARARKRVVDEPGAGGDRAG